LPNGIVTEYGYDAASRLTGLTYKNGPNVLGTLTYAYDNAGSRGQIGGTWARTGLPQSMASATYNAANHQLTFGGQSLTYDLNGDLTSDGTTTYTWDTRNRLASLSGPGMSATFQYDPLSRRTRKVINSTTTDFLYDGINPVQELSGGSPVANLLIGLGIDEYFTRADSAGTRALLTDALGSTVALTDPTAAVQSQYTYEAFGGVAISGETNGNPFQYTGRENDGTGLRYYRARYYHAAVQRFISEDPIEFAGGQVNPYVYVRNNPMLWSDALGLKIDLYRLNQAIVDRGLLDDSFTLKVTGGDRYLDCAGGVRSLKTHEIVPGSDRTSPHLIKNGARALDLRVTGVSNSLFDSALRGTDFAPRYTQRYRHTRHTHISLPNERRFDVPPDSLPPRLSGRKDPCGQ
jgi:RHS repeat-associated protein